MSVNCLMYDRFTYMSEICRGLRISKIEVPHNRQPRCLQEQVRHDVECDTTWHLLADATYRGFFNEGNLCVRDSVLNQSHPKFASAHTADPTLAHDARLADRRRHGRMTALPETCQAPRKKSLRDILCVFRLLANYTQLNVSFRLH